MVTSLTVDWEDWNHMDFQTAIDAPRWMLLLSSETYLIFAMYRLLYDFMLDEMERYVEIVE